MPLLLADGFDNFSLIKDFPGECVTADGPAEIVDILTHRVTVDGANGIAAFVIKGRSFPTVRPKDVAHQIFRLTRIEGLKVAVLASAGIILDEVKEQFLHTAEWIRCDYAFLDSTDLARLFVVYGFFCPRDAQRITAGRCPCGYSPKKRILNVLQREALRELSRAHDLHQRAGVVILPPGGGKTRIAAEDAKNRGANSILYVAHTHEILEVAQSEFVGLFGIEEVTWHAAAPSLTQPNRVNLATVQLLRRHLGSLHPGQVQYMVIDEFHHAAAASYRRLLEHVRPDFLLGLTATPFRADHQDIVALCEGRVLVNFELRTGIEKAILSPYHYFGCFDDIDYSRIQTKGERYDIRDLERALIIPERDEAIIRKWKELAEGKPTIAFCCTHKHARRVSQSFSDGGIKSEVYLADTPLDIRKRLADELYKGELKILCTVDVLNEGADMPFLECLLFLRPTESQRVFYQQLGRGLRRCVGKAHCTVIDFIGNFKNAYKIPEYQELLPIEYGDVAQEFGRSKNARDVLNLPLGCEVHFEDRVIDIFAQQVLDPRYATRHSIGRILLYEYDKLAKKLGRVPSRKDVNRNLVLNTWFYEHVFGSWAKFQAQAKDRLEGLLSSTG